MSDKRSEIDTIYNNCLSYFIYIDKLSQKLTSFILKTYKRQVSDKSGTLFC